MAAATLRAYHRVDPLMDERKSHYTPAQFGTFLKVLLLAGRQSNRGRFRSVAALRMSLPTTYSKHIPFLVDEGDLVERDGWIYVDGWDEWQEGDVNVGERMRLLRERRGIDVMPGHGPRILPVVSGAARTAAWRLRNRVFERDSFTCRYCGVTDYPRGWLIAEHVIPKGPTTEENLVTACRGCNKRKGGRTPEEAGMLLRDVS